VLGYSVTGPATAPVLVLGGSLGTSREMWRPQLPALTDRFRVLRYDHPGHGGTPTPSGRYSIERLVRDVLTLLDHLGVERCHYAGLSLGGMVGMGLAASAPDRVDRLALLCTSAYLPPADAWHQRAAQVRAHGMGSLTAAVTARWFTPRFRATAPDQVATLLAAFTETAPEGYAACCEAIADLDLRAHLPRITAATLVIAGADDPATPPTHAEVIADTIPGARMIVLPGAAHLASVEQAPAVTRLLVDHFDPGSSDDRSL